MALLNVADVVQSVATLMDDPGQTEIDLDYCLPFINLRWSNIIVNLVMLGLQYSEEMMVVAIPAGTVSLTNLMLPGQPLASLMQPKSIEWKMVGADDTTYVDAKQVDELDDYPLGNQGIQEYSWQGGTILVVPSAVDVTARIRFKAMSTNLVDPTDNMIRGIPDIIGYRVAQILYSIRGNAALAAVMKTEGDQALDDFCAMSVMNSQGTVTTVPPTHRRSRYGSAFFIR